MNRRSDDAANEQPNEPRRSPRRSLGYACVLLFLCLLQVVACTDPPPLCSDEKPCPAGFLCREGVCICVDGSVLCGESCVFLATDSANCGGCGVKCDDRQQCVQGVCRCATPYSDCNGACTDTQTDANHCGQCGVQCSKDEACVSGQCSNGCPDNLPDRCGSRCTDTQRDTQHCGGCSKPCEPGLGCFSGKCGCPVGTNLCDGVCVDLLRDLTNCGGCGKACNKGQVCSSGRCATTCPGSTPTNCFGGCVDVQSDTLHCGGCGNACSQGQICRNGRCQCLPELSACDGKCVDLRSTHAQCGGCNRQCGKGRVCARGRCASNCPTGTPDVCFGGCFDSKTDKRHCGKCGNACPGLEVCTDGKCGCPTGYIKCEGNCVDPKTHPLHCGGCGTVCANGQQCGDGKCETTCPGGTPDLCFGGCFDKKADDRHCATCGFSCLGGSRCENSSCICPKPLQACDGLCLDLQTDQLHCGVCGRTCPAGERCSGGNCILDCDTKTLCGNVCVDTQTDASHCGQCDNKCEGGSVCKAGKCGCDGDKSVCGGVCVNTDTDEQNCGQCGTTCKDGEVCVKGACQRVCVDPKLSPCNGACFNLKSSILHCGSCGNTCAPGQTCDAGKCTCQASLTLCAGQCVDMQVALNHCGECGKTCAADQFCQAGTCKKCNDAAPLACGNTCCVTGQNCCNSTYCADFQRDPKNCGGCGKACPVGDVCDKGQCAKCADGQTRPCYTGTAQTRNVGECADGVETCQNEVWGACTGSKLPSAEVCDGKDNNCDGKTDETFTTLGDACTSGQGICKASGTNVCNQAGNGVTCNATPGMGTAEMCDNIDNDCDGQIDNGVKGPNCSNQTGVCMGARQSCSQGKFVACTAADYGADYEVAETKCDGKDNDCDGQTDEGLIRAGPACANQVGWCKGSQKSCVNGQWAACTAREFGVSYLPAAAVETLCDGKDNDCDGTIDEGCTACAPTKALATLTHVQAARWLDFSPDGKEVAAGAFFGRLRIWAVATSTQLQNLTMSTGPLGLQYNPFLAELGISRADFAFYDPSNGMVVRALASHLPTQNDLAFRPDGRMAATVGADQKLIVWDLKTYKSTKTVTLPAVPDSVAWSSDGKTIAVGMQNNEIYLGDPNATGQPMMLKGHTASVNSVAFSPDGKLLASTSADKTVRLWNAVTGAQVWSQTSTGTLSGVAWRWDNKMIAVGQTIFLELRNVSNGAVANSIRAHAGAIADVAWSPDGRTVGTSSSDRTIKLWECP